ncbi:MAG: lipid-binding SYLF domain-containing protein [Alphaproteobacteria bacterium]|nr:lipid-binding SYLF domain-containing protein [Alphaproteobacteria bacterium]
MPSIRSNLFAVAMLGAIAFSAAPASADQQELQETVDRATTTFNAFVNDPDKRWFRRHIERARGVFIVPKLIRAGLGFGGSGGSGVLLGRDSKTGEWSYPAFYSMGSVTFGLQIGVEVSSVLMLVMTTAGMDALLSTDFKIGVDASIAVGPVGTGVATHTFDILLYSRDRGLFGGLTIDGSLISPQDSKNRKYYGKSATTVDVIVLRNVYNPGADALRTAIARVTKGQASPPPASAPGASTPAE